MHTPSTKAFDQLLARLDGDREVAAEKYVILRLKLVRFFDWRGCAGSDADSLADQALDRVAEKLAEGREIDNLAAYSVAVARFVWLEHHRKHREDVAADELPEVAVEPDLTIFDDADERLECLAECLIEVTSDERERRLIIGYYDTDPGDKTKEHRKKLAESFGISLNLLKVRACRLRAKLESCINECVDRVTNPTKKVTNQREVI